MASLDTGVDMVSVGEGSSSGSAGLSSLVPSTSSKKPKRFEVKKWNAVALWAWAFVFQNFISKAWGMGLGDQFSKIFNCTFC